MTRIIAALALVLACPAAAHAYTGEPTPYGTPPAEPHLYANGAIINEHGKTILHWGPITMSSPTTGPVQCKSVMVTHLTNELTSREVEGKRETYLGPGRGYWLTWQPVECVGGNMTISRGEGPNAELVEPKGGPPKLALRGMSVTLGNGGLAKGSGELQPNVLNDGISIGAMPNEAAFSPSTGELSGGIFTPEGRLKFDGYGAQELLDVRSP